jgi:hypothetical protein
MRLLALTIAAGLAVTACAPGPSAVDAGGESQGVIDPARPSGGTGAGTGSPAGSGSAGSGSAGSGSAGSDTGAGSSRPAASSTPSAVDSRCPADLTESGQHNNSQAQPVPSGIEVDWVLRCTVTGLHGDHSRGLLIERSDSDPAALLAALRAPDEPRSGGECPAIAMVVPYFALVRPDGKPFVARMPLTSCALPQPAAMQALERMRFELIGKKSLP